MKAATHRGTCQVCGHVQKLPGGELSRHGYTKRWGFFSGTCPGSGWRPFEVAHDRIRGAITDTQQAIGRLEAESAALMAAPIESPAASAPFLRYNAFARGRVETSVAVYEDPRDGGRGVRLVFPDGKVEYGITHGFRNVEVTVTKLREERRARIAQAIAQRAEYIAWQEQRIREWAPGELQPVEPTVPAGAAR